MKIETRNRKIVAMYLTSEYSLRYIGKQFKLSDGRIKQIIAMEIGVDKFKEIKRMRAARVAEKLKEDYIKTIS